MKDKTHAVSKVTEDQGRTENNGRCQGQLDHCGRQSHKLVSGRAIHRHHVVPYSSWDLDVKDWVAL